MEKNVFLRTMRFINPYKKEFVVRICLSILNAVMGLVASYGLSTLIRAAQEKNAGYWQKGICILVVSLLVEASSLVLSSCLMARVSFGSLRDIRDRVVTHLMKTPMDFYGNTHTGDISSRMTNDISVLQNFINNRLTIYLYYPVRFLTALLFMGSISVKLTFACCLIIPISIYVPQLFLKKIEGKSLTLQEDMGKVNESMEELIAGISVRKCAGEATFISRYFQDRNRKVLADQMYLTKLHTWIGILGEICQAFPMITCVLYGVYLAKNGFLQIYQLSFFIFSIDFLAQPIRNLPDMLEAWKKTKGAAARILTLLDAESEKEGNCLEEGVFTAPVVLKNVSFAYEKTPVLCDISLTGERNQVIAIVGPSGSGKSTLLHLVGSFYGKYTGEIQLFGHELGQWRLEELRSHIGAVFQEKFLFPGSIKDNIAMGKKDASMEEIMEAAKNANAHDFIMKLEKGYDTYVGERGMRLSGGQIQRITIARAILKNAPLLLLDEPTSALDIYAEKQVQNAIEYLMKGKTVFIVAHRMNTILNADRIVVLHQGKIVDQGSHGELVKRCGLYREFYEKESFAQVEDAYE